MQNNLVVGPKTYKESTYIRIYKNVQWNCKCSKEIIGDLETFKKLFHFIIKLKTIEQFSKDTIFFTFQQGLPDFLHLQQLCTLELICQVRGNGHRWIRCNVCLRCDTTNQKHFFFWDEAGTLMFLGEIAWVNNIINTILYIYIYISTIGNLAFKWYCKIYL